MRFKQVVKIKCYSVFMFKTRFINYIKFEKRYSSHTLLAYKLEIEKFEEFLQSEHIQFEEVDYKFLRYYFTVLREGGKEPSSINRSISALKSYYKFLLRERLISHNPMRLIPSLKVGRKLPIVIENDKLETLLNAMEAAKDSFEEHRDFLIIELLFGTGIRLSELLKIKEQDVDFYNKKLLILGKRNKVRFVPLHQTLIEGLKTYIERKKEQNWEEESEILVVTKRGKAAYPSLIYKVVKENLASITTQKKRSPHVLRHSFATTLLNKGADLNAIKELLGHAGLSATQVYTHNSIERLKTIYKQAHPKA